LQSCKSADSLVNRGAHQGLVYLEMARKPRVEFPGGLYHVISRGNDRRAIFRDDGDRKQFLELLAKYRKQQGFRLFAFVLMTNHFHLLIETSSVPLSKTMQQFLGSYTRYFNRRYHRVGHLFQGRYKAILCETDPYLLELIRYIHLNPVRSKIVRDPVAYRWSSHRVYLGKEERDFVDVSAVLKMMGKGLTVARKAYSKFVLDRISQGHREDYYQTREQRFLGSEVFVEEIKSQVEEGDEKMSKRREIGLKVILMAVSGTLHVPSNRILSDSQGREASLARGLVAYLARKREGYSGKSVADFLYRDPSVIVRMVERVEGKIREEGRFKKLTESLVRDLREKA